MQIVNKLQLNKDKLMLKNLVFNFSKYQHAIKLILKNLSMH